MSDTNSSPEVWPDASPVAMENLETQEGLFASITDARIASGASPSKIAAKLGINEEQYLDIERGGADLRLSELRQVAFAIDAVIAYNVQTDASTRFNLDFDVIMNFLADADVPVEEPTSYESLRS